LTDRAVDFRVVTVSVCVCVCACHGHDTERALARGHDTERTRPWGYHEIPEFEQIDAQALSEFRRRFYKFSCAMSDYDLCFDSPLWAAGSRPGPKTRPPKKFKMKMLSTLIILTHITISNSFLASHNTLLKKPRSLWESLCPSALSGPIEPYKSNSPARDLYLFEEDREPDFLSSSDGSRPRRRRPLFRERNRVMSENQNR
jgi:hypothetical protein